MREYVNFLYITIFSWTIAYIVKAVSSLKYLNIASEQNQSDFIRVPRSFRLNRSKYTWNITKRWIPERLRFIITKTAYAKYDQKEVNRKFNKIMLNELTIDTQLNTAIELVEDNVINDLIYVRDWSNCIEKAPNDQYMIPENIVPINHGCQTRIVHKTSTRVIYDFCYEFCKLSRNGLTPKALFCGLNRYFHITSYNLSLGSILINYSGSISSILFLTFQDYLGYKNSIGPFYVPINLFILDSYVLKRGMPFGIRSRFISKYFISISSRNFRSHLRKNTMFRLSGILILLVLLKPCLNFFLEIYEFQYDDESVDKTFINYRLAMWISFSYILILVVYAHINALQTNKLHVPNFPILFKSKFNAISHIFYRTLVIPLLHHLIIYCRTTEVKFELQSFAQEVLECFITYIAIIFILFLIDYFMTNFCSYLMRNYSIKSFSNESFDNEYEYAWILNKFSGDKITVGEFIEWIWIFIGVFFVFVPPNLLILRDIFKSFLNDLFEQCF